MYIHVHDIATRQCDFIHGSYFSGRSQRSLGKGRYVTLFSQTLYLGLLAVTTGCLYKLCFAVRRCYRINTVIANLPSIVPQNPPALSQDVVFVWHVVTVGFHPIVGDVAVSIAANTAHLLTVY